MKPFGISFYRVIHSKSLHFVAIKLHTCIFVCVLSLKMIIFKQIKRMSELMSVNHSYFLGKTRIQLISANFVSISLHPIVHLYLETFSLQMNISTAKILLVIVNNNICENRILTSVCHLVCKIRFFLTGSHS